MRRMNRFFLGLILIGVGGLMASAGKSFAKEARVVTIPWRAVKNAYFYEIQLSKSPEMYPLVYQKKVRATKIKLRLPPNTYYFRVRGVQKDKRVGP